MMALRILNKIFMEYQEQGQVPESMDENTWSRISRCLTASWNAY